MDRGIEKFIERHADKIDLNGHEWLARQLDQQQIAYRKLDDAFLRVGDVEKTQGVADGFERVDWVRALDGYITETRGHVASTGT